MPRVTAKGDLTDGTEFDVDLGAKTLTLNVAGNVTAGSANGVDGLPLHQALSDLWKSGSTHNRYVMPFFMADGPIGQMLELRDGWTITNFSLLRNCGLALYSTSDVLLKAYACFVQLGTVKTATDQPYHLLTGTTPSNFGVADEVNECIEIYDSAGTDKRTSGVASFFVRTAGDTYLGYDLLAEQAISALTYRVYQIPGGTVADSEIVTSSPSGAPFDSMTLTLGATTNTINATSYDFAEGEIEANGGTAQQVYDWFQNELLLTSNIDAGAGTQRGNTYLDGKLTFSGGVITTSQGLTIKNIASADESNIIHVDDTGASRQKAVTANASVTGMPTAGGEIRLQVYNVTEATEIYNDDPESSSWTLSYTDGSEFSAGDSFRIRFSELNAGTTFKTYETTGFAASSGLTVVVDEVADLVYSSNGLDGSGITKFSADFSNDEIDLSANENFVAAEAYAFYCMQLTTAAGIEGFWGGVIAADSGNYKIITSVLSLFFDNTTTASKRQTDSARIYRDDDAYPVKEPTTSGYGIDVNWQNVVYVVSTGGSALTTAENSKLMALPSAANVIDEFETQSQADPTGFHVNVKEINAVVIQGDGTEPDPLRAVGVDP